MARALPQSTRQPVGSPPSHPSSCGEETFQQSWGALEPPLRGRRPGLLARLRAVVGGSVFSDPKAAEGMCEEGLACLSPWS